MHFAYPPRKSSNPPPFLPRSTKLSALRRSRWRIPALIGVAILCLLFLFSQVGHRHSGPRARRPPSGRPRAVIVTVFDETNYKSEYLDLIRDNRKHYAEKHGYELFLPRIGSYDLKGSPLSWTKVVAMRDALTKFPDASYFWFLDQDAFIMNPHLTVQDHLMNTAKLEAAMLKDLPVVPPDSIIKTFSHLRGQDVDLVITQDKDGLSVGSFILRNTDWAIFFLETWFDPLYRSYNFQKAETHALEHIVQWHPTILSKLAIVPQKTINAYSNMDHGLLYEKGDIAVRFVDCLKTSSGPSCETDAHRFIQQWRNEYSR